MVDADADGAGTTYMLLRRTVLYVCPGVKPFPRSWALHTYIKERFFFGVQIGTTVILLTNLRTLLW